MAVTLSTVDHNAPQLNGATNEHAAAETSVTHTLDEARDQTAVNSLAEETLPMASVEDAGACQSPVPEVDNVPPPPPIQEENQQAPPPIQEYVVLGKCTIQVQVFAHG